MSSQQQNYRRVKVHYVVSRWIVPFATVKSVLSPHFPQRRTTCRPEGGRSARIEERTVRATLCDRLTTSMHAGDPRSGGCGPKGACTGFTYLPLSRLGDTVRSRCASLNRVTVIDPRHVARGGRFPGVMRLALSHGLACSARTRSLFSVAAGYYAA